MRAILLLAMMTWTTATDAQRAAAVASDAYGYSAVRSPSPHCESNWVTLDQPHALTLEPAGAAPADDDGAALVELSAPFEFYGEARTAMQVSSNGYLAFVDDTRREDGGDWRANCPLPAIPDNAVASFARIQALQQDLERGAQGGLFWQHFTSCPRPASAGSEPCTVVLWQGWQRRNQIGTLDFQVLLYPSSREIALQFGQLAPDAAAGATVGLQNDGADSALMLVCGAAPPPVNDSAWCLFEPRFPPGGTTPQIFADGFEQPS